MVTPVVSPADDGRRRLGVVLALLFATGWAANHFASMIPVLRRAEGFSTSTLDGAFGVYALGLLPGLLGGGGLSDRIGRRPVMLTGAAVAAAGNLLMLVQHHEVGIYAGRLVVGLGVGLTVSAGTAWAGDLGGRRGTTLSGAILTSGFATGPLVSGLIAQFIPTSAALVVPFAVTVLLSIAATGLAVRATAPSSAPSSAAPQAAPWPDRREPRPVLPQDDGHGVAVALAASVPMALWVFSAVTVPIVVLAGRMESRFSGPWVPGMASAVALGTGVLIQIVARRLNWGPLAGVTGAVLAAVGFAATAAAGDPPGLPLFLLIAVVLGSAYGLCLREGLLDVEALAPSRSRGTVIGIFYVCTYLGFGLPVLLEVIRPAAGTVTPLLVLAVVALFAATVRTVHIRTTSHLIR